MMSWARTKRPVAAAAAAAVLALAGAGLAAPPAAAGPGGGHAAGTWRIATVAGGVGGPGPARQIAAPDCAVAAGPGGVYATGPGYRSFSDYYPYAPSVIRRISLRTGQLTTAAGSGFGGFRRDTANGTPAAQAAIASSCGVARDHRGNLVFTDQLGWVKVAAARTGHYFGQHMSAGRVYAIGGDGTSGYSGDGGPAVDASLQIPAGVTVDPAGNVVVDDSGNNVLRLIAARSGTFYGQHMTAGDIYTVAGGGHQAGASGIPATSASLELRDNDGEYPGVQPWSVVSADSAGNIVLAQGGQVAPALIEVVAGRTGTFYGRAMTAGDIYSITGAGTGFASGIPARHANVGMAGGVATDADGNILVTAASQGEHRLYVIANRAGRHYGRAMRAGYIYWLAGNGTDGFAGDGGPARRAEFSGPDGVTVDADGNIVLADGAGTGFDAFLQNARVRVIAGRTGRFYGEKMTAGDVYTISGNTGRTFYGDSGPARRALLGGVVAGAIPADTGIAATRSGGLVFADSLNNRVRLVPATTGTFFGRKMTAGDIYTIAGTGQPGDAANGSPGTAAGVAHPAGAVVDSDGNVLFTDAGNNRVRFIPAGSGRAYGQAVRAGRLYVLAGTGQPGASGDGGPARSARLRAPAGITLDHHGNVVVTDQGNGRVQVIAARTGTDDRTAMLAGRVYTVARLRGTGAAVDAAGNIIVASASKLWVEAERTGRFYGQRMVAGRAYAIAGGGKAGAVGDGIPAVSADLAPGGVAIGRSGSILITDKARSASLTSGRVRVVAVRAGTFYGVAMTAGDIYTIAGSGSAGLGDGGPARQARFSDPTGVAVPPSGSVLILDFDRIRLISR